MTTTPPEDLTDEQDDVKRRIDFAVEQSGGCPIAYSFFDIWWTATTGYLPEKVREVAQRHGWEKRDAGQ